MPTQKDLKRLVRSRMQKTGEAYTAARLHILKKRKPVPQAPSPRPAPQGRSDYATLAGKSDTVVSAKTGRTWAEWVRELDDARAIEKPHREIAQLVSSLGAPSWWAQMVTVGYERIRGLREVGQRLNGSYEASKSRTFDVSVETLYGAFANARTRRRWLTAKVAVRAATENKRLRLTWDDDTPVEIWFTAKGNAKSVVAIAHQKLPDRSAAAAIKKTWAQQLDRLGQILA